MAQRAHRMFLGCAAHMAHASWQKVWVSEQIWLILQNNSKTEWNSPIYIIAALWWKPSAACWSSTTGWTPPTSWNASWAPAATSTCMCLQVIFTGTISTSTSSGGGRRTLAQPLPTCYRATSSTTIVPPRRLPTLGWRRATNGTTTTLA